MKEKILSLLNNAASLEKLYQANPEAFTLGFNELYPEIKGIPAAEFWFARLNFDTLPFANNIIEVPAASENETNRFNLLFTIIASLIAGTLVKAADYSGFSNPDYYIHNISFFVLPLLIIYYLARFKPGLKLIITYASAVIIGVGFINFMPFQAKSDTHILSSMHLVLFMWVLWGLAFLNFDHKSPERRLIFIKRNGDILILTAVILAGGAFLTFLTFLLFSFIKLNFQEFYIKNVGAYGVAAAPIVANYMIESNASIVKAVGAFIAKIFAPLVLVTITALLVMLVIFAFDPFNTRDELISYNVLLIAVLAILIFSFSDNETVHLSLYNKLLLILSTEAIIINSIALSAIIYRLFAFGITPNRLAVTGGNILMFINLIFITLYLFRYVRKKIDITVLRQGFTFMMPYYFAWSVLVSFIFPFIFWFK